MMSIIGLGLGPVLLQVTAVAVAALTLIRAVGRGRPELRYVVSLGALVCVLLSPALTGLGRRTGGVPIRVPYLVAPASPGAASAPPDAVGREEAGGGGAASSQRGPSSGAAPSSPSRPMERRPWGWAWLMGLSGPLTAAWCGGCLWHLARLLRGRREVRALLRGASPLAGEDVASLLGDVRAVLGAESLPPVLVAPRAPVPLVVGARRPRVLLPAGLPGRLTRAQLRAVLVHECAHVALGHSWSGLAQRAAALLFWPHPLVHLLARELSRAREEVCDNFVLRGGDAAGYARTLLLVASGMAPSARPPALLGLLPGQWRLEERVAGLLDPGRRRGTRAGRRLTLLVGSALAGVGAGTAVVRPVPSRSGPTANAGPVRLTPRPSPRLASVSVRGTGVRIARLREPPAAAAPTAGPATDHAARAPRVASAHWPPGYDRRHRREGQFERAGAHPRGVERSRAWVFRARPPSFRVTVRPSSSVPALVAHHHVSVPPLAALSPVAEAAASAGDVASTSVKVPMDRIRGLPVPDVPGAGAQPSAPAPPLVDAWLPGEWTPSAERRPGPRFRIAFGVRPPMDSRSPRTSRAEQSGFMGPLRGAKDLAGRDARTITVWVNTRTGNYHYPGDRWYGTTHVGEYMGEPQAAARGYHPTGAWSPQAL